MLSQFVMDYEKKLVNTKMTFEKANQLEVIVIIINLVKKY